MRRLFKKFKVKLTRSYKNFNKDKTFPILTTHQIGSSIFRRALRDDNVDLILMPVVNKRIIKLEKKGLYIVLQHSLLEITNHKYSYHLEINFELFTKLSKLFDAKLELNFKEEEETINEQLSGGLKKVLELINKK
jgi:hypothetical protein